MVPEEDLTQPVREEDIHPIEQFATMIDYMLAFSGPGPAFARERVAKDITAEGVIVSTVYVGDLDLYETALILVDIGQIRIVQRYRTREEALAEHPVWLAKAKLGQKYQDLGLPGVAEGFWFTLGEDK